MGDVTANSNQAAAPVVQGVVISGSFRLGGDYSVEYETNPDDDFPWSLYSGDEKITAYKTPQAVVDDLDCYDDDIVPPDRWHDLWDWVFATR